MRKLCLLVAALCLPLGSIAADKPEKAASPTLETVKKLAGDWVAVDKDGKPTDQIVSSIRVTAGGSAVVETLFPGSDHEMVSVYHMDGKDLVMTHYCMLGNQPKLKAEQGTGANKIVFKFTSITNLKSEDSPYMREGTMTIVDENTVKSDWVQYDKGKAAGNHGFQMVRKKK